MGNNHIFWTPHNFTMALGSYVKHLLCCEHTMIVYNFRKFLLPDVKIEMGYGTSFKSTAHTVPWKSHSSQVFHCEERVLISCTISFLISCTIFHFDFPLCFTCGLITFTKDYY